MVSTKIQLIIITINYLLKKYPMQIYTNKNKKTLSATLNFSTFITFNNYFSNY